MQILTNRWTYPRTKLCGEEHSNNEQLWNYSKNTRRRQVIVTEEIYESDVASFGWATVVRAKKFPQTQQGVCTLSKSIFALSDYVEKHKTYLVKRLPPEFEFELKVSKAKLVKLFTKYTMLAAHRVKRKLVKPYKKYNMSAWAQWECRTTRVCSLRKRRSKRKQMQYESWSIRTSRSKRGVGAWPRQNFKERQERPRKKEVRLRHNIFHARATAVVNRLIVMSPSASAFTWPTASFHLIDCPLVWPV